MHKSVLCVVVVGAAAMITSASGGGATASATSYRGIEPVVMAGNPKCADLPDLGPTTQVAFDPPVNGSAGDGIYILVNSDGYGWYVDRATRDVLVAAVIVKGGAGANVYRYPPPSGPEPFNGATYSDGQLVAPVNTKARKSEPYALGTLTFCY